VHRALAEDRVGELRAAIERMRLENQRRNDLLAALLAVALLALVIFAVSLA
jgi:hypothetical protein